MQLQALLAPSTSAVPVHPAIERCLQAGRAAHAEAHSQEKAPHECEERFRQAYLLALPDLSTRESVCAFIACIGFAMVNSVIYQDEARRCFYAAHVALCAVPRPGSNPESSPKSHPVPEPVTQPASQPSQKAAA